MNAVTSSSTREQDAQAIFEWCAKYIGQILNLEPERIVQTDSLDVLGLDSATATSMVIELENRFGVDVPIAMVFAEPTLGDIAYRIAERMADAACERGAA
ncbi:acyl carrier protein [Burkholderia ubonensis]|uniref:acyl carrier protein n=1 Tax=Burkholderia ubonensis TaxID=101571 RepID=UPI00358E025C